MRFGAVFPTNEIGDDPVAIRDWAQAAEALGYAHIATYDHVLGAVHEGREPKLWGPYSEKHPFHEPFVLFGFLAATTRDIVLETSIVILPQRQAALVAKQAAEVDVLSGGRLRLGVGSGWNPVEYEALGVEWAGRGSLFDEQVALLRALWENDVVDFDGEFHRVDRAGIAPRPTRRIPLWFGGGTLPAMRRAARLGDGFVFGGATRRLADQIADLDRALTDEGRDPGTFDKEVTLPYGLGPDRWADVVTKVAEAGCGHVTVNTMSSTADWAGYPAPNLTTTAAHIGALETFIGAVT